MHVKRTLAWLFLTAALAPAAGAAPLRCPEDAEGGACVWGRAEGFEASAVQVRGLRIQLLGVQAPSPRDLCTNKTAKTEFACGRPANKRMGELLAKGVACDIMDVTGDTLYGRCRVAEGDLARMLVTAGLLRATKDGAYEPEQVAAMAGRKGLWAADIIPPKDWEAARRRSEKD
ncbi:MAG: thermonuclease family protein [Rhodospirillaceae bacterium]|nr:thermonuclease family protein [Rhodospirillales bacterium]